VVAQYHRICPFKFVLLRFLSFFGMPNVDGAARDTPNAVLAAVQHISYVTVRCGVDCVSQEALPGSNALAHELFRNGFALCVFYKWRAFVLL
jgi:hypothetical protein